MLIPFQIEHVRVAIAVGFVWRAICITAHLIAWQKDWAVFYSGALLRQRATPSFLFFRTNTNYSAENHSRLRSQYAFARKILKSRNRSISFFHFYFTTTIKVSKYQNLKVSKFKKFKVLNFKKTC